MKKFIFLYIPITILLFHCSITIERSETPTNYSQEQVSSWVNQKDLILWNLVKSPIDEDGFVSLKEFKDLKIETVKVEKSVATYNNIILTFNSNQFYILQNNTYCDSTNSSYTNILNSLAEGSVLCVSSPKEGYPKMLIIGKSANEKVYNLKKDKKYYSTLKPALIKSYKVKTDKTL